MDKENQIDGVKDTVSEKEAQKKNGTGISLKAKLVAAAIGALAVLLAILIPILVKDSVEKKVRKAFETYVGVFVTGDIDADKVKWKKYYPAEVEEEIGNWAHESLAPSSFFAPGDYDYKIMAITQLDGSDSDELVQELVEDFYRYHNFSIKTADLKISKAYLVIIRNYSGQGPALGYALVVKVNGKYGVYSLANEM